MPFLLKKLPGSNHVVLLRDADGVMKKVLPEGTVFAHEPKGVDQTIDVEEISNAQASRLLAARAAKEKKEEPKKDDEPKPGELRKDGPTLLAYVNAGYPPDKYPPEGWEAKPYGEEELAAALKRYDELLPKVPKKDEPKA